MKKLTQKCVKWVKDYFEQTNGSNAIVGISGGKDSSVVAALCCKALGNDRVIGVLMPNGIQKDIEDSKKVCEFLGIEQCVVDISTIYNSAINGVFNSSDKITEVSQQAKINLAPRIRMAVLYSISQCMNGRVVNTSNFDESLMGYATLWGDSVGDLAPLANMHVSQVIKMGLDLGLEDWMVSKPPSDGLTGKTDEESLGFSYADVETMYAKYTNYNGNFTEREQRAFERMNAMSWKRNLVCGIPSFDDDAIYEQWKQL